MLFLFQDLSIQSETIVFTSLILQKNLDKYINTLFKGIESDLRFSKQIGVTTYTCML